jgi:tetratricopeptide (TPR) repeat protein
MLSSACVYYNGIYNAQNLFAAGERHRLAGADSLAEARYQDVVRKAATGFRRDTEGPWADEALYLIGRARLRMGELHAARAALLHASEVTDDEQIRLGALLYVGAAHLGYGDAEGGLALLNQALEGLSEGPVLAEGHLLRAGVLLAGGETDAGWWDLDRAAELDTGLRVSAAMERVRWGVHHGNLNRVREGARLLLFYP